MFDILRKAPDAPKAHHLSDEKQAEWVIQIKQWEKENPIDKPAKNAAAFGLGSGIICTGAIAIQMDVGLDNLSATPLFGIFFGLTLFAVAKRRYLRWAEKRASFSKTLIAELSNDQ